MKKLKIKNVELCELIEDQEDECYELIEYQKVEFCKDQEVEFCELIEDREDECCEDINMLKLSGNKPDGIKKLNI